MTIYTLWGNSKNSNTTMVEGEEPPMYANGKDMPDCEILISWFEANSFEEALKMRNEFFAEDGSV